MPRNTNTTIQNRFTGGLITQATALNFPANAAIAANNCVFSEVGTVSRRPGFEFENNFTTTHLPATEFAQSTYFWKNASSDGATNLVVQQTGGTLTFYNSGSSNSLSGGISANTVSLSSFIASGATTDNLNQNECQYSTGLGYLFVVHPYCDPFYVQYNPSNGTFTASIITFTIRDTDGINETGVLPDARSGSLTANHEYNLLNQGWSTAQIQTFFTGSLIATPSAPTLTASTSGGSLATGTVFVKVTLVDAAGETVASAETSQAVTGPTASVVVASPTSSGNAVGYKVYASTTTGTEKLQNGGASIPLGTSYTITTIATGTASPPTSNTTQNYPSNSDVWWVFKDSTNAFVVNATTLASNSRASTPAPQGYFRLNPWNTARAATCTTQAGVTLTLTGTVDKTSGALRPSVTEFHAGRVWYAGVNAAGYTGLIYFSRVAQDPTDFGYCGSTNDPTSETLFDFVASDGGIIAIPQAGTIYKMVSMGSNLIIFGANGVWTISGSRGIGFSASDYSVANVSYDRSISGTSFVVVGDQIMWWNISDINVLQNTQTGYAVQSMTYSKIKDYYVAIPSQSKKTARGVYNPRTHLVHWLFRTASITGLTDTYAYDSVLNYNTISGAFYPYSVDISGVRINSIVTIEGAGSSTATSSIVSNAAATVTDSLGNPLVTYGFAAVTFQTTTKYLVSYFNGTDYTFTFAESFNPNFVDWQVYNSGVGLTYTSTFTTGFQIKTQGERAFQSNYIFVFSDLSAIALEGQPSYTFQGQWDYGAANTTGQFTQRQTIPQNVTHNETNYAAGRRRLKVRGQGNSLQFTFTSRTNLPFHIIGWSTFDTSDAHP